MKRAYISFHVYNYGIGFTKNILGAFYSGRIGQKELDSDSLQQNDLEENAFKLKSSKSILFDKVFYLYVNQPTINKITSTRLMKQKDCRQKISEDELMQENVDKWNVILETKTSDQLELKSEFEYINKNYSSNSKKLISLYWRIIHYYDISDQMEWLFSYANSKEIYDISNFQQVNLEERFGLNDLHDHRKIASAIREFLREEEISNNFDNVIINISGVGYEIQVVWFALAQAGLLDDKFRFITTYDEKDQNIRFKDFRIREISKKVLEELSEQVRIFDNEPVSEKRKLAAKELKLYIEKGFSIIILGERGIGKTRLIQDNTQVSRDKFMSISAAAFDDDEKLESELFGYEKGAFTGAVQRMDGLFHVVSPGGILFIDEIHAMSKRVQEKLMSALSTNNEGEFIFKRVRAKKTETAKFTIIFASNKQLDELKYKYLLPDFYDRVVQYTITIPPLREAREDIKSDWKAVWAHQKFKTKMACPENEDLFNWLKSIELSGNWRDLQRIAIWYDAYNSFDKEHKKIIGFVNALDYVKDQYEKVCSRTDNAPKSEFNFNIELTANGQVDEYQKELALWAKDLKGSFKKAAAFFNEKGDSITEKTLYNWANKEVSNP